MFQFFVIYIILGILTLLFLFTIYQVFKLKKKLNIFLKEGDKDLGHILEDLIGKSDISRRNIDEILEKISRLEETAKVSFQKVGVVRYSPFKEIGGDQSFSIAFLDNQDSGFVITSLYLREGTRIFAKPIHRGKSEYLLSEEETKAIKEAVAPEN